MHALQPVSEGFLGQPPETSAAMQIPRVELVEMGPSMNLALRRLRAAGQDMEREAMARPKTTKKKVSFFSTR